MIRVLLLGMILIGTGIGFQRGWIQLNWNQFYSDLGVPLNRSGEPDFTKGLSDSPSKQR